MFCALPPTNHLSIGLGEGAFEQEKLLPTEHPKHKFEGKNMQANGMKNERIGAPEESWQPRFRFWPRGCT